MVTLDVCVQAAAARLVGPEPHAVQVVAAKPPLVLLKSIADLLLMHPAGGAMLRSASHLLQSPELGPYTKRKLRCGLME